MRHAHTSKNVSRSITSDQSQVVILSKDAYIAMRTCATEGAKTLNERTPFSEHEKKTVLETLVGFGCDPTQLWAGAESEAESLFEHGQVAEEQTA